MQIVKIWSMMNIKKNKCQKDDTIMTNFLIKHWG